MAPQAHQQQKVMHMPKKPSLPGAADFFAVEEMSQPAGDSSQAPAPRRPAPAPTPPQRLAGRVEEPALTIPEGPTEKVTFYLQPMLLKRLALLKAQMLVDQNLKVSRSQMIELLLEEGLHDAAGLTEKLRARAR